MNLGKTTTTSVLGRWLGTWALGAALVAGVTLPASAQERDRKLDRGLRDKIQKLDNGEEADAPVKVIVTLKPGARSGLDKKMKGRGRHKGDFSVIRGGAAELTASRLRELANDDDVEAVSVDADVTSDGIASTVSGAALNTGFSLKSTLGLKGAAATTTTTSFQQGGANAYAGVLDTGVDMLSPSTTMATNATVWVDAGATSQAAMAVKFTNIFGTGAGQIPPGSTITSATLRLRQVDVGLSTASLAVYRITSDWDGTVTWNNKGTVGMASSPDAAVTNLATAGLKTLSGAGLTAAVQSWANGNANYGWAVVINSGALQMGTSEDLTLANRPLLTVTYKAPANTSTLTGNGVTVAVIDSGLLEDGGTTTRIKTTRDFTTGATNPPHIAPVDGYGHGTHIAGLIGGNKTEVEGVATNVKFVSLKVLNAAGVGSTSYVINAIQWAIANKAAYGIDVINLSLGHPILEKAATDPLVQAVEAATRAGITVVVAAGNMGINPATGKVGYTGISSPANAPSAITVGSSRTLNTTTRTDDLVSDFSSRGPTWFDGFEKPDLVAPGQYLLGPATTAQGLYTSVPVLRGPSYGGRAYMYMSGTSMAAGVVSGTVALMIEQSRLNFLGARPTTNAIKAMLQRSAFPLKDATGATYDRLTQGAGELNATGAAQLAGALNPNATLGWNWIAGSFTRTTPIDGQVISWNDNVVWGTTVLWGSSLDNKLNAWNDNVVWGSEDNVVWGTSLPANRMTNNIVWGSSVGWEDNVVWGTSTDNVVWGTGLDNVVWGSRNPSLVNGSCDNVVWGTDDNVVWGTSTLITPAP